MKKTLLTLFFVMGIFANVFSQATSLTVDCQTPGWLSSMIEYEDQVKVTDLKVTGYINSTDLAFIGTLMDYELNGKLDLSEVTIVKKGSYEQNTFFTNTFGLKGEKHLRCLELPNNLTTISDKWAKASSTSNGGQLLLDTLVIGGEDLATINKSQLQSSKPISIIIREGVKYLDNKLGSSLYRNMGTSFPSTKTVSLPSSLKTIGDGFFVNSTTIHSLNLPDSLEKIGNYSFAGTSFLPRTLYLPISLKEFYFSSVINTIPGVIYFSENTTYIDNSEYYDNNSGSSWYSSNTGYRPILSNESVEIHIKSKTIPEMKVANKYDDNKNVYKNCTFYVCADLVDQYRNTQFYKNGTIVAEKEIEKIIIQKNNYYYVGDHITFSASYQPLDATDVRIKWKSNDSNVISFSEDGEAKCQNFGHTTVTASTSYNRLVENVEINVFEHTTGIEIDKNNIVLCVGETDTIKAFVFPIGLSDGRVSWKSTNEEIVKVDSVGKVKAIKPGECMIICITQDREYKANCSIKVVQPVTSIKLSQENCHMSKIGDIVQLIATVMPEDASNKEVKWSSTNEDVCIVANGKVIATGFGTAKVIATTVDGDFTASCTITVEKDSVPVSPAIIFADANVKAICVSNWDTNDDGELNEMEADKVTSLGTLFQKSLISSFNELQYFTSLTEIGEGAFSGSTVKEITLPDNITSLRKDAFLSCMSLTSLHLPDKVREIGLNALSGCITMTSITVDEENQNFCDIDGVLFSKDKETLLQFPSAKSSAYTVPEGTTTLARDAFYMSKLETVELPPSLKEIGYDAFGWCRQLTNLVIPEGVTVIGDYILDGCTSLISLHIPASVTSIGQYIGNGCKAITDVWNHSKKPFAINSNNFTSSTYANATLHIPYGLKIVYEDTEGWKNFAHIVDDIVAATLSAEDLTINLGHSANLIIGLSNNEKIDGVQFDLTLPAGVSIAKDNHGEYIAETTDRSSKLFAQCAKLGDNLYRIILKSTKRETISNGDKGILRIKLECDQNVTPRAYDLAFTSVSLSRQEGYVSVNEPNDDFTCRLTVYKASTIRGDVNGDYEINITDVLVIVDYILGRPNRIFLFSNADMDKNGTVNITDALNVVNIILDRKTSEAPKAAKVSEFDLLRIGSDNTGCHISTVAGIPDITAMQMDVVLPADCRLRAATLTGKASMTHQVMTHELENGRYRVVVFSSKKALLDTDAAILNLEIEGRGGLVSAEDIQCFDAQNMPILSPDLSAVLTGISPIYADSDGDAPVYNISGQRVSKKQRGINIVNGSKVVVK